MDLNGTNNIEKYQNDQISHSNWICIYFLVYIFFNPSIYCIILVGLMYNLTASTCEDNEPNKTRQK